MHIIATMELLRTFTDYKRMRFYCCINQEDWLTLVGGKNKKKLIKLYSESNPYSEHLHLHILGKPSMICCIAPIETTNFDFL